MRIPLIIANWKMNYGVEESLSFVESFQEITRAEKVEVVICPPFTSLDSVASTLKNKVARIGAQNCHFEESGAFTGEISPVFLKELGCTFVLLGHSERRHIFGETDEQISKKVKAVLKQGLTAVLCVGEKLEEREDGKTWQVIGAQLQASLSVISPADMKNIVIAYEPVWAIGTGKNATPAMAEEVHQSIRKWIDENKGRTVAEGFRILYGGSVNQDNAASLMKEPDIDGLLIGGASLKVDSFSRIINDASIL